MNMNEYTKNPTHWEEGVQTYAQEPQSRFWEQGLQERSYVVEPQRFEEVGYVPAPQMGQPAVYASEPLAAQPAVYAPEPLAVQSAAYAPAPQTIQPVVYAPVDPTEAKADSFSKTSSALVVLGLLLVGGAIGPLLTYFHVQATLTYFIGLAYIVLATLTVMWLVGKMFAHSSRKDVFVRTTRVAVLVAAEIALDLLARSCSQFELRWETTAVIFAALLLLLHFVPSAQKRYDAYALLRANELAIIFVIAALMVFNSSHPRTLWQQPEAASLITSIMFAVALALVIAVVVLRVRELWENRAEAHSLAANAGFLVFTALGFTSIIAAFVYGATPLYNNAYAYDVVFMAGGLLCVTLGFTSQQSSLRLTGLVITLCTVAKMVFIDTLSYDLLSRALAYVIGGVVCFAIGAIYNYAVKRLVDETGVKGEEVVDEQ